MNKMVRIEMNEIEHGDSTARVTLNRREGDRRVFEV